MPYGGGEWASAGSDRTSSSRAPVAPAYEICADSIGTCAHGWLARHAAWRMVGGLSALAVSACSEPIAVDSDQEPPEVVRPTETDTLQASVEVENHLSGDLGWRDQEKADAAALALWASPYAASVGDTLDLLVHA